MNYSMKTKDKCFIFLHNFAEPENSFWSMLWQDEIHFIKLFFELTLFDYAEIVYNVSFPALRKKNVYKPQEHVYWQTIMLNCYSTSVHTEVEPWNGPQVCVDLSIHTTS